MKRSFYSGISGKIALSFLLAFVFLILPINTIIYFKLSATLEQADSQQIKSEAEKIARQLSLDPLIVPLPAAGYQLKVQTTDGQFFQSIFQSPQFPELEEAFFLMDELNIDSLKIFTLRQDMEFGGEILISLARSNQSVQSQLANFRLYLFYLTGLAVLLIIVGVFTISGLMLRPIKKIIDGSQQIVTAAELTNLPIPKQNDESKELALSLNAMLDRIKKSNDVQQKFFDSATHELKTPLAIMKAALTKSHQSGESSQKILNEVLEEVNRLDRTISDFLLVSQLRNHALNLKKDSFDFIELFYECLKAINTIATAHDVGFSIQQEDATCVVKADKDKIKIVLFNLLENAVQYSDKQEAVSVKIDCRSNGVAMEVQNKTSLKSADIEMLGKERFAHSSSARGLGLGLWISKQIVDLHQGELYFSRENNFFTVHLSLPKSS